MANVRIVVIVLAALPPCRLAVGLLARIASPLAWRAYRRWGALRSERGRCSGQDMCRQRGVQP
jgi:hypothetical protein